MPSKLTLDIFIERSTHIHKNLYDYSFVVYINCTTPVLIKCNSCGKVFEQLPHSHMSGRGCRDCGYIKNASNRKYTKEVFIRKATEKHGDKYDYSFIDNFSYKNHVKLICNFCKNIFYQKPLDHLSGCGCEICGNKRKYWSIGKSNDLMPFVSYPQRKLVPSSEYS